MYKSKRILGIILARVGSRRLKDKMLLPFGTSTVVETVIERIKNSRLIDTFTLATSESPADSVFEGIASRHGIGFFRGSENDVVARMLCAVKKIEPLPDIIVRICSDNPLMMPSVVDEGIETLVDFKGDIMTPFRFNTYPFGYSAVAMTRQCLEKIDAEAKLDKYREHVENFCFDFPNKFRVLYQKAPEDMRLPELSLTLDYESDYWKLKEIYALMREIPLNEQPRRLVKTAKNIKSEIEKR